MLIFPKKLKNLLYFTPFLRQNIVETFGEKARNSKPESLKYNVSCHTSESSLWKMLLETSDGTLQFKGIVK